MGRIVMPFGRGGRAGLPGTASIILVLVVVFCMVAARELESPEIALCAAVIGVVLSAIADVRVLMTVLWFVYSLLATAFSNVLIERGAYIAEQGRSGFYIGSTWWISAATLLFLGACHIGLRTFGAKRSIVSMVSTGSRSASILRVGIVFLGAVCLGLLAIALVSHGAIVWASHNRFAAQQGLPPLLQTGFQLARSATVVLVCLLAIKRVVDGRLFRTGVSLVILANLLLFCMGERVSIFIWQLLAIAGGIGIAHLAEGRRVQWQRSGIAWMIGFAAVGFAAVFSKYVVGTEQDVASLGETYQVFSTRLALQGHVFFGIVEFVQSGGWLELGELVHEGSLANPAGLSRLSYVVADPSFVYRRLSQGVSFTMGGPALPLAVYGLGLGVVVFGASGCLVGLWFRFIVGALRQRMAWSVVSLLLLYPLVTDGVLMGNWQFVFSKTMVLYLIVGAFAFVIDAGERAALSTKTLGTPVPQFGQNS